MWKALQVKIFLAIVLSAGCSGQSSVLLPTVNNTIGSSGKPETNAIKPQTLNLSDMVEQISSCCDDRGPIYVPKGAFESVEYRAYWSPDGRKIAIHTVAHPAPTSHGDHYVTLLDAQLGDVLGTWLLDESNLAGPISDSAWSTDSRYLRLTQNLNNNLGYAFAIHELDVSQKKFGFKKQKLLSTEITSMEADSRFNSSGALASLNEQGNALALLSASDANKIDSYDLKIIALLNKNVKNLVHITGTPVHVPIWLKNGDIVITMNEKTPDNLTLLKSYRVTQNGAISLAFETKEGQFLGVSSVRARLLFRLSADSVKSAGLSPGIEFSQKEKYFMYWDLATDSKQVFKGSLQSFNLSYLNLSLEDDLLNRSDSPSFVVGSEFWNGYGQSEYEALQLIILNESGQSLKKSFDFSPQSIVRKQITAMVAPEPQSTYPGQPKMNLSMNIISQHPESGQFLIRLENIGLSFKTSTPLFYLWNPQNNAIKPLAFSRQTLLDSTQKVSPGS